jgi:hypothetical protein
MLAFLNMAGFRQYAIKFVDFLAQEIYGKDYKEKGKIAAGKKFGE